MLFTKTSEKNKIKIITLFVRRIKSNQIKIIHHNIFIVYLQEVYFQENTRGNFFFLRSKYFAEFICKEFSIIHIAEKITIYLRP